MSGRTFCLALALALAACSEPAPEQPEAADRTGNAEPPAPGTPGGLPDDRRPVAEGPFAETGAQGAANVVQTYYALLEQGRHGEARRLWSGAGEASGLGEAAFAASFAAFAEYHAQIGAPGAIEGAAGSLYVEVPIVLYGRLKSGEAYSRKAAATLRRVNDVPGSSADDRRWHIHRIAEAGEDSRD
jgi:hypothetical protein